MTKLVTRESLADYVGKQIGISEWLDVTQERVNGFADITEDHQYIHIDPVAAAKTPFGGTIAHGFLTLSLLARFAETGAGIGIKDAVMGINYGFNKVRFLQPVRVGKRVRAHARLLSADEKKPGQFLFTTEISVEIEGEEKPALIAEWLTMAICK